MIISDNEAIVQGLIGSLLGETDEEVIKATHAEIDLVKAATQRFRDELSEILRRQEEKSQE